MKTLTTLVLIVFLTAGCSMTGPARADDAAFTQAELDSMLAPVALYPDSVLSHVLIAATYPLEVIQAARWSREHPGLRGEEAVAAVEHRNWDASVKALVAFPDLLQRMDDDLDWTQNIGDAFLLQEEDVVASIQYLRSEAYSHGKLRSNEHVKVVREKEYIYIEPARTRVVYVPYYDPRVVYTSWRWSSHPPRYWNRPRGYRTSVSFYWGSPYRIRPSFYFSSFHWPTRKVVVVNHHHHYYRDHRFHSGRQVARFDHARHWKHDPKHRRGVSYRGRVERTRFVEGRRPDSARVQSSGSRNTAVRSERRQWAAEQRSRSDFSSRASSRNRAATRSGESRSSSRSDERAAAGRSQARAAARDNSRESSERSSAVRSASRSGSSRDSSARAASRSRGSSEARRSSDDSARSSSRSRSVTESLRSSGRSSSRSSGASARSSDSGRSATRSTGSSRSRAAPQRSRSSSVDRSDRGSSATRGLRGSGESARSRTRSSSGSVSRGRSSASPSRSRDSAPARRSSSAASSSRGSASGRSGSTRSSSPSRASTPSRSSKSSRAPSRSSSRGASSRSSRGSSPSRSRGGDSRRGGGDDDERR